MRLSYKRVGAVAIGVALAIASARAVAQDQVTGIVLGKSAFVYSEVLNEDREVYIALPLGYEVTERTYPVLYVLDGDRSFHHATATTQFLARNGRIPQMIVVAIPNTNRWRDFTPTQIPTRPGGGGADRFLEFIERELIPFIDGNYRTEPFRVLAGHSLGGMLTVYSLFSKPALFGGYLAASPYLMFDENHVVRAARRAVVDKKALEKSLYVTLGDEPDYVETLKKFTDLLEDSTPEGLLWEFVTMEGEDHGSTWLKTVYDGLESIYADWRVDALPEDGVAGIRARFERLSDRFGYKILPPESAINQLGYELLGEDRIEEAIEVFIMNIENYPQSANVYDSLGEAYEANSQLRMAKMNYEIAYKKGMENSDRFTPIYKQHLDNVTERLGSYD